MVIGALCGSDPIVVGTTLPFRSSVFYPLKRFAWTMGFVFAVTALVLYLAVSNIPAKAMLTVVAVFASLDAFVGFCAACFVLSHLMP